jgi:[ribosomal protein S18]-alanine N-acetyltransferase
MKEMRRLDVPAKKDLFERGRTSVVRSFEISREEGERLQKERLELIAAKDSGVMLLNPQGGRVWLSYGFTSIDALRREFRPMLEGLAGSLKASEAKDGIYLHFTDHPNRPYIEPVLEECFFTLRHEWMEMTLAGLPEERLPGDEITPGFLFRVAVPTEYDAIAALDGAAFGEDAFRRDYVAEFAQRATELRVLEERAGRRLVGFAGLFSEEGRTGKINPIAVHPEFQRRGLGEAMLRWSLAWFRREGLRRARLFVRADNVAAIALYRKLGFVPGYRGLTYRRPADKKELAEVAKKRTGTFVKFGGWR